MSYHTKDQVKAELLKLIPAAAKHNTTMRPSPIFCASQATIECGSYTLISSLYVEIDERFTRRQIEEALVDLMHEGKIWTIPESAQGDLSEHDRRLALRVGNQHHHWLQVI